MQQNRGQRITERLTQAFMPTHFSLVDDSHQHGSGTRQQSHFSATLVSAKFDGLSRIKRHQQVMALLTEEFNTGLHAFSAKLLTPDEWQRQPTAHQVPPCQHQKQQEDKRT